jgi:hypothetical protein
MGKLKSESLGSFVGINSKYAYAEITDLISANNTDLLLVFAGNEEHNFRIICGDW